MSPQVTISIPTKDGIDAETVSWVLRTFVELRPNVEFQPVKTPYPLVHQRNLQVHRFLESAFRGSHIFFLDSDCIPPARAIQRLLEHDLAIVAIPTPARKGEETGYTVLDRVNGSGYRQHSPLEGLQKVDAVGMTGVLIRRGVFEHVPPPWFGETYDKRGLLACGEDFWFCERLREHGIDIYADCTMAQQHHVMEVL